MAKQNHKILSKENSREIVLQVMVLSTMPMIGLKILLVQKFIIIHTVISYVTMHTLALKFPLKSISYITENYIKASTGHWPKSLIPIEILLMICGVTIIQRPLIL